MTRHSGAKILRPGVFGPTLLPRVTFSSKEKSSALGMCAPGSPHIHSSSAENYPGPGLGVLMAIHTPKIILAELFPGPGLGVALPPHTTMV